MRFIGRMMGWCGPPLQGRLVVIDEKADMTPDHGHIEEGLEVFVRGPGGGFSTCRVIAILDGAIDAKVASDISREVAGRVP